MLHGIQVQISSWRQQVKVMGMVSVEDGRRRSILCRVIAWIQTRDQKTLGEGIPGRTRAAQKPQGSHHPNSLRQQMAAVVGVRWRHSKRLHSRRWRQFGRLDSIELCNPNKELVLAWRNWILKRGIGWRRSTTWLASQVLLWCWKSGANTKRLQVRNSVWPGQT